MKIFTKRFFGSLITNPPYWILKIWLQISNQPPEKPRSKHFHEYSWKVTLRRPPYWIRHLKFWKSDVGFVISDPKNPLVNIFINFLENLLSASAIFDPPSWILKIWHLIRNQRPRKPPSTHFHDHWTIKKMYASKR